jgi:ribose 5-phosphate isomerase A
MSTDTYKQEAAEQAAALVESGMVVGLGTGSTAAYFISSLIRRASEGLDIVCIPSSERSAEQARAGGLKLVSFATHRSIDLAVDGADEIKRDSLDLTKGLGGALLREKIVACAAKRFIIIADGEKLVDWLGTRAPIPIEVTPFGWELTADRIREEGADVIRRQTTNGDPYHTDGGNYILDARFTPIADAASLQRRLLQIVGVIETGLFVGMAEMALVASSEGVTRFTPQSI